MIPLALGAALIYGVADFLGGFAARRSAPVAVATVTQLSGLLVLGAFPPVLPASEPSGHDIVSAALAGVLGGFGLALLFRSFSAGAMSVTAPLAALCAAALPAVAGIALGERPSAPALVGIAIALPAVALVSRQSGLEGGHAHAPPSAIAAALAAGIAFGGYFVLVGGSSDESGVWPLLVARAASVAVLAPVAVGRRGVGGSGLRNVLPTAVLSGSLDMAANVLFLLAARGGLISLVSVVTSLYPAGTVLLARIVLDERLRPVQLVGLAGTGLAVALISAG